MKEELFDKVVKDLSFSGDLDKDVSEQAGLYFYYATKWAEASKKVLIAKADLEYLEAKIKKELRQRASDEGKKITEGYLDEAVLNDSEYRKVLNKYIDMKEEELFWQIVKEAMKQKKDMLEAWVNVNMILRWSGEQIKNEEIAVIKERLREKIKAKTMKEENNGV